MICVLVSSFFAPAEWNQNLNDLAKRAAVAWVASPLNFLNSSITGARAKPMEIRFWTSFSVNLSLGEMTFGSTGATGAWAAEADSCRALASSRSSISVRDEASASDRGPERRAQSGNSPSGRKGVSVLVVPITSTLRFKSIRHYMNSEC